MIHPQIGHVRSSVEQRREKVEIFGLSFCPRLIKLEENAEACLRHDSMGRTRKNMITGKIVSHCSEAFGGQKLLDGDVRKLNDPGPIDIGNGNQAWTR